jgi:outer membrane protein assembly factor BamB
MPRRAFLPVLAVLVGCSVTAPPAGGDPATAAPPAATAAATGELPPDLGTRKQGVDWAAFLGPNADSTSPETGILKPWPKGGLKVVWSCEVGGRGAHGYAMPTVSRGRLFLFDRVGDVQRLRCLVSETGKLLWEFKYPTAYADKYGYDGGPRCCPVVDGDRVYAYGPEGWLHCLRAADGAVVWKHDTANEYGVVQNFFGVGSTPVIEGDLLITAVGGSPKGSDDSDFQSLKGNGSTVVAFDKLTGEVRWKFGDELASYSTPLITTVNGKRLGLYFARGGLLGFDPAAGKQEFFFPWRAPTLESVNAANPVVAGDRVLVTETYGPGSAFLKLKPGGYNVLWDEKATDYRDKHFQCHWNTPIHVDGYVYGSSGRHEANAELRCVELATGKVMWSKKGLSRASLLKVDGHFVCQCEDGVLLLLKINPKEYEEVSRLEPSRLQRGGGRTPGGLELDYPCWAAPVLSHGLLYVRGKDRLYCLELIPKG